MNKPMSIKEAVDDILTLAKRIQGLRAVIDNPNKSFELRYHAVVIEEASLDVMQRYITHIDKLKEISVNGQSLDKDDS